MKLYVVGLGPGSLDGMTMQAMNALRASDVLVGYTVYLDLIREAFPEKRFLSTPMKQEAQRCRMAVEEALKGQTVSMVCSGDSGVYGMAGLVYEVSQEYEPIEIEIIPGVTAACSGAALLGAPLIHDFALISLSDLLTPLEKIHQRLDCAAQADFALCLYNPASKKRRDYLRDACEIILRYRNEETPAGIVRNIGREGQEARVLTLGQLRDEQVDMFTTVFIGNSQTKRIGEKMVTPRGYRL